MAKIFLSPLIVDIRAKQADTVFSKWRGVNYIRSRVVPANPKTSNQTAVRNALATLVSLWNDQLGYIKKNRDLYATGKTKSGFNTFIGDNVLHQRDSELLDLTKPSNKTPFSSFTATTGPASGQIDVSYSPNAASDHVVLLLYRKQGAKVWAGSAKYTSGGYVTISGLEPGETYEVYCIALSSDSAASALTGNDISDDLSATAVAKS